MTFDLYGRSNYFRQIWWAIDSLSPISHGAEVTYFTSNEHRLQLYQILETLDSQSKINAHFLSLPLLPLGKYFEHLVQFALEVDPHYEIIIKNHPVNVDSVTLGEIDLILKRTNTQTYEHWEIALKYYLQHGADDPSMMIGPSGNDTLASKLEKLAARQLPLGQHPSIIAKIACAPTSRLFFKGMFFHHFHSYIQLKLANTSAESGWWIYDSEMEILEDLSVDGWSILDKTDWIGRVCLQSMPPFSLNGLVMLIKNQVDLRSRSICVAGFLRKENGYVEVTRGFIRSSKFSPTM